MRLVFALVLVAMAMPAVAAEPAPLPDSVAMLIQYLAGIAATAVVGWIALAANRLFGVSLEARHREALHSALATGASLALSMVAQMVAQGMKPAEARDAALQAGVDYVRRSVPDALKTLKPTENLLFDMVRAKQAQLELSRSSPFVVDFGDRRPTIPVRG